FDHPEERVTLVDEESREHFFENFKLEKDSAFTNLVIKTMNLFDSQYHKSKFLTSAYDFWEKSYAKEPEEVPKNWKVIMDDAGIETSKENLFKFMFCLETTYALFTRLILAKSCEDYKFPGIDFSDFIKSEIKRESYHGEISQVSWPVLVYKLIENMRFKLVESIFEEDIFYWWVDSFRELRGRELFSRKKVSKEMILFGESLAELLMTLYKFDFSEIVGDPLGTLYQKYFDKKTRKALGEFYTPKEVVNYIEDAVGYKGRKILDKRLLDPACGSGTFLVEALKRYLRTSESKAEKEGWSHILNKLCNEYHIVGFDIHPFATIMAQIQIMLILIPYYKKAMEEDRSFVLKRIPIFRTDSLVDESKSERMTLKTFQESARSISMTLELPIKGKEGEFVKREFIMPYYKEVFSQTDLHNNEEYFSAFQALFDVVKENAKEGKYSVERDQLERTLKEYLEDKNWHSLSLFFKPYAEQLLAEIKTLKHDFGDGRLVKSIEDVMLASILKNYVKYDFVVGNPPYIRTRKFTKEENKRLRESLYTPYGSFDIFVPFLEKGIRWLEGNGKLGYITSNKYFVADYGKVLRPYILNNCEIEQLLDLSFCPDIFEEPLIYSAISILKRR
ncbi:MAG: Eco57I restriction-modification methylase domain-containing protein, partial [Candidatus Aenigmatarchaeota archaeon]